MPRSRSIRAVQKGEPPGTFEVIILGGGPAGLSAALWLGRCGRNTLVLDADEPRNAASRALHGFLTRDGVPPAELRRLGRTDIRRYPSVTLRNASVRSIRRTRGVFEVTTEAQHSFRATLILLATGRLDPVPNAPDFRRFFGRGVYHCVYCDGWEHRGGALAVYGHGAGAAGIVKLLRTWSEDLLVCTDGHPSSTALRHLEVRIVTTPIARLNPGRTGNLAGIAFADGTARRCRALFFSSDCAQKSDLPRRLGCRFDRDGAVVCRRHAAAGVPGLFVAGNVRNGVHLAITAAAEGAEAALAMNESLLEKSRPRRSGATPRRGRQRR
jgi:thioredoxin reductase